MEPSLQAEYAFLIVQLPHILTGLTSKEDFENAASEYATSQGFKWKVEKMAVSGIRPRLWLKARLLSLYPEKESGVNKRITVPLWQFRESR